MKTLFYLSSLPSSPISTVRYKCTLLSYRRSEPNGPTHVMVSRRLLVNDNPHPYGWLGRPFWRRHRVWWTAEGETENVRNPHKYLFLFYFCNYLKEKEENNKKGREQKCQRSQVLRCVRCLVLGAVGHLWLLFLPMVNRVVIFAHECLQMCPLGHKYFF